MGSGSHDISYRDFQEFIYALTHHIPVMILAKDQELRRRDFFSFLQGENRTEAEKKKVTHILVKAEMEIRDRKN